MDCTETWLSYPVVDRDEDSEDYRGQEYLGLYPYVVKDGHIGKTHDDLYIHKSEDKFLYFVSWLNGDPFE